jgi:uncharacterized membrane protein
MADVTSAGNPTVSERRLHAVLEVSLFIKGVLAVFEIIGGVAAYLIPEDLILR